MFYTKIGEGKSDWNISLFHQVYVHKYIQFVYTTDRHILTYSQMQCIAMYQMRLCGWPRVFVMRPWHKRLNLWNAWNRDSAEDRGKDTTECGMWWRNTMYAKIYQPKWYGPTDTKMCVELRKYRRYTFVKSKCSLSAPAYERTNERYLLMCESVWECMDMTLSSCFLDIFALTPKSIYYVFYFLSIHFSSFSLESTVMSYWEMFAAHSQREKEKMIQNSHQNPSIKCTHKSHFILSFFSHIDFHLLSTSNVDIHST